MERHERGEARVIPIVLRPVIWDEAPFGKLQVLPTGAEPVSSKSWHTKDHAFFDIAKGIQRMAKEFITRSQAEEIQQVQVKHVDKVGEDTNDHGARNSIIELFQPLTSTPPQCTWVVPWPDGYRLKNIELKYDDRPESSPDHYKYRMRDDIQQAIADWGTRNEDGEPLKALRMRLEEQAEAVQVRIKRMEWRHYVNEKPAYKYVIWLEPTRYLYYDAIHANLGKNAQLRHLRERYFHNAFIDLDKGVLLELPCGA